MSPAGCNNQDSGPVLPRAAWVLPALCLLLLLPSGCRVVQPDPLAAWAAGEMVNLTETLPQPGEDAVYDRDSATVRLIAAANETVSFQLVIEGRQSGLEDVTVEFSPLGGAAGALPAEQVDLFRMWPVRVSELPAWYLRLTDERPTATGFYDALIPAGAPRHGMPYTIAPGGRLALWVDLRVPRDARAGAYAGTVTIRARRPIPPEQDNLTGRLRRLAPSQAPPPLAAQMKLTLRVYDFVLPDTRPLVTLGGFDHTMLFQYFLRRDGKPYVPAWMDRSDPQVRRGLALLRQLMTLAHEHRIDLVDRSIRPVMKRALDGQVELHWEDYDAIVKPYLDGTAFEDRLGVPAWPAPFDESFPDPQRYGGIDSEAYRRTAQAVLEQTARHFEQLNLHERLFAWPLRSPSGADPYGRYATLAALVRLAAPSVPILSELPPEPPAAMGFAVPEDYRGLFDLLAPPAHLLDAQAQAGARRADEPLSGLYLAPGLPPYMPSLDVLASPADVRAIPWLAHRHGLTGLLLPEVLHWEGNPFELVSRNQVRLFYPGTFAGLDEVLPSVRLKRLRRGLQDVAYLWLLQQRDRPAVAEAMAESLARYVGLAASGDHYLDARLNGWARDGQSWHLAHALLAEEVLDAVRPGQSTPQQLLAQRVAWNRFNDLARTVRVERVRTRVERMSETDLLVVKVWVDLYNELSRPAAVQLKLGELPEGLAPVQGQDQVQPLPPARQTQLQVSFQGSYLPTDATGKLTVPLELITDHQRRLPLHAQVPLLVSAPATAPVTVDGDLSDWPLRRGHTAGGFRLLGRRGQEAQVGPLETGLAARQSLAFVMHDRDWLYLALRMDAPASEPLVAQPNNLIHYDQLLAAGEDLIEILFDPGAAGTGAEDLYHLAIKPNGVLLAEKGVQSDPPLGLVQPWPAGAKVAMRRTQNAWFVELAIPRAAFGPNARQTCWGFNVIRYSTYRDESSSWSGTPRYYYHPQNLGTLLIMPDE